MGSLVELSLQFGIYDVVDFLTIFQVGRSISPGGPVAKVLSQQSLCRVNVERSFVSRDLWKPSHT